MRRVWRAMRIWRQLGSRYLFRLPGEAGGRARRAPTGGESTRSVRRCWQQHWLALRWLPPAIQAAAIVHGQPADVLQLPRGRPRPRGRRLHALQVQRIRRILLTERLSPKWLCGTGQSKILFTYRSSLRNPVLRPYIILVVQTGPAQKVHRADTGALKYTQPTPLHPVSGAQ